MDSPHLDAFGDRELLGPGPCGAVFRALTPEGNPVAVKVLDGMAINRSILENACARLEEGGWPAGVLPVLQADFRSRPAARVTACLADEVDGGWVPRSLQHRLNDYPGEDSWRVVLGLAEAVASLHDRQVAHGNLKPGNVFLDEGGEPVLVDWGLGNMPGIGHLEFTDACLYQPPEQLKSPDGFLEERGYRWDVFAFGVIAYRLLTGMFPRCDETFQKVAPEAGKITREGLVADFARVGRSVEASPAVHWPTEAANELEISYREIIDSCLAIDPLVRPASGLEVRRCFREAERAAAEEQARDAVLDQSRHSQRSAWRSRVMAIVLGAAAVLLGLLWQLGQSQLRNQIDERGFEVAQLSENLKAAKGDLGHAQEEEKEAKMALQLERDTWMARIEESRMIGDRLFGWAMEKGMRKLPTLEGREIRLTRLERYFSRFIERTAGEAELGEERARARLQLAEISLAKGDPKLAASRLEEAIAGIQHLDEGPELDLRLATDRLFLALLLQEKGDPAAEDGYLSARKALEAVPQTGIDGDRVIQLLAILDIQESKMMAARGEEALALERLHRATVSLNELADNRPETSILRSELASCYLSSAAILDGMGEMGDARTVRTLAADELVRLIKLKPADIELRLELAGCYGAIAQSAVIAGDVANAEAMSKAAVKLLEGVLPMQPDNAVARSRLAAQRGLMAGLLRDQGKAEEAIKLYDEGLGLIEPLAVGEDAEPLAKYRLALLKWEKGKMMGYSGNRELEIRLEEDAVGLLRELEESPYGVVRSEQVRRSLSYVLGDLGLAAQILGDKELAKRAFGEAVKGWEVLGRERPGSEEYEEALAWTRQRLGEIR